MKKSFLLLIALISSNYLFSQEYIKKYSSTESWIGEPPVISGNSIFELTVFEINNNELHAEIFHTLTPYSQVINENIVMKFNKGKYEFSFTDKFNNKAFGWLIIKDDTAELYLDCNEFDETGKTFARLYGETAILHDTSSDKKY